MYRKKLSLFLILYLYICPVYSVNIIEKFSESNNLIEANNFKKAKIILKEIQKEKPNNLQIINNLAYIEARTGNIDNAISILRKSLSKDKDIDIVYRNLTNLYAYQANILYEEALSIKDSAKKEINLFLIKDINLNNEENIKIVKVADSQQINDNVKQDDIKNFIKNWSKYWQNKNYQEYFNSYSQNYFSKKFKSNEAWKKDRKSKIENKKNIEIKISDIKVISFDNKNALVQFTQSYNSDSFSDVVKKHIIVSIISSNYKITGEFILK